MTNYYCYETLKQKATSSECSELLATVKEYYDSHYAGNKIPALPFSVYKLIYTTGDRRQWERPYFDVRNRLCCLQILALTDNGYLDDLEDTLAAIVEEYTWILPAHNLRSDKTFDHSRVDLFCSETAFYLAQTYHVFKELLCPEIKSRILKSVWDKAIYPFMCDPNYLDNCYSNWVAVCVGSIASACLYAHYDKWKLIEARVFKFMEQYLEGLGDDGLCREGVSYWKYGFGFFTLFMDNYAEMTGTLPPVVESQKVGNVLQFYENARLSEDKFLSFADCSTDSLYFKYENLFPFKRVYGDRFSVPLVSEKFNPSGEALGFQTILGYEYVCRDVAAVQQGKVYYPSGDVFAFKNARYSMFCKGGNNDEVHNHNDLGAFGIVYQNRHILLDYGSPEYTFQYFNDDEYRYSEEVFVAGSKGHNLPIIDGQGQGAGKNYYAAVINHSDNSVKFDLKNAYEPKLNLLTSEYTCDADSMTAVYEFAAEKAVSVVYRFISAVPPEVRGNEVVMAGIALRCPQDLVLSIREVSVKSHAWNRHSIYAVDFAEPDKKENGLRKFEFYFLN